MIPAAQPGDPSLIALAVIGFGVPILAYVAVRSLRECRLTRAQRFRLALARAIHP